MTEHDLAARYQRYIDCLNRRDWPALSEFVAEELVYNGSTLGLDGYTAMLRENVAAIPDLVFTIALTAVEGDLLASRLSFDCTPKGAFMGLPIDGRRVSFTENVFYRWRDGRIAQVWSIVDKAAIERQLNDAV